MTAERDVILAAGMMFAGAAGIAAVSFGTAAANVPTIASPYSLTVLIALFGGWGTVAYLLWPTVFLLWSIQLFARVPRIPVRSAILGCLAVIGSALWVLVHWSEGVAHQGMVHVVALGLLNLSVAAALCWLLMRSRRRPTFAGSYVFHWTLFAWAAWSALPWLGEGI